MYQICLSLTHTAQGPLGRVCVLVGPHICELRVLPDLRLSTLIQMLGLPPLSRFVKSSCFSPSSSPMLISSFFPDKSFAPGEKWFGRQSTC